MKRLLQTIAVLLGLGLVSHAQEAGNSRVQNLRLERNGDYMAVSMDLDLTGLELRNDRAIVLTPEFTSSDSLAVLPSVGVYSHNRWYYYKRSGNTMITGADETSWKESQAPESMEYKAIIPYEEWMDGSAFSLKVGEYGCCRKLVGSRSTYVAVYEEPKAVEEKALYVPEYIYVTPHVEVVKSRSLSGTAYIGFPVNKTTIYPDFQDNHNELAKIRATIDSVRNDADVTIKAMSIKGFASPESPYDNNARLAKGRTQALKRYVSDLYNFAPDFISTSFEPEDWDGLRTFVEASSLPHKAEILEIIDSDREPDNKEWKIKSEYAEDYRYMLDNFYPYLRHSDYLVEYVIRSYSDPDEIGRILKTRPQNLSLNEFYVYAQTLEPGSPEYAEVFETAVRMYPEDEIANLNAANTAMARGDLIGAVRYLDKAGTSPEAIYAKGICAYLTGDMKTAREMLQKALDLGVDKAEEILSNIE